MDKVINCLFAALTLLLSARGEVFKGKDDYLEMFFRCRTHAWSLIVPQPGHEVELICG